MVVLIGTIISLVCGVESRACDQVRRSVLAASKSREAQHKADAKWKLQDQMRWLPY
jgi:hypothetical protein